MRAMVGSTGSREVATLWVPLSARAMWVPLNARLCGFRVSPLLATLLATLWGHVTAHTCGLQSLCKYVGSRDCEKWWVPLVPLRWRLCGLLCLRKPYGFSSMCTSVGSFDCAKLWVPVNARIGGVNAQTSGLPSVCKSVSSLECATWWVPVNARGCGFHWLP